MTIISDDGNALTSLLLGTSGTICIAASLCHSWFCHMCCGPGHPTLTLPAVRAALRWALRTRGCRSRHLLPGGWVLGLWPRWGMGGGETDMATSTWVPNALVWEAQVTWGVPCRDDSD